MEPNLGYIPAMARGGQKTKGKPASAKSDSKRVRQSARVRAAAQDSSGLPSARGRTSPHALDLSHYFPSIVTALATTITATASAVYRPKFGIGITDWRIMAILGSRPWISSAEICEAAALDKAAVSRSLAHLQKIKAIDIVTDRTDQRRQFVALTKSGLKIHDRIGKLALKREAQLLEDFSARDKQALLRFLARIQKRTGTVLGASAPRGKAAPPRKAKD